MSVIVTDVDMPERCVDCFRKHLVRGQKIIDGRIHDMWYGDCKNEFVETLYHAMNPRIIRDGKRKDCPLLPKDLPKKET